MTRSRLQACLLALALLPAADTWRGADGNFGAMLVVTDRLDEFLRDWSKPDDPAHPPTIHPATSVTRGDVVWGVIVFSHCAPDAHGRCRAVADFTVLRPDGTVYGTQAGAQVWSSAPPPHGNMQLSAARLGIRIEPQDPLGVYQVRAVVKDLQAGRSVTLERRLTVAATK